MTADAQRVSKLRVFHSEGETSKHQASKPAGVIELPSHPHPASLVHRARVRISCHTFKTCALQHATISLYPHRLTIAGPLNEALCLRAVADHCFYHCDLTHIHRHFRRRQQRQEQASAYHHRATGISDYSRPSSSAGSAHTLRRTPRLDDAPLPRAHSKNTTARIIRSPPSAPSGYERLFLLTATTPSTPYLSFTPDLEEENAQMSDLGTGRASNGGARTHGPVPVTGSGTPSGIRTPRDVMRDRNAREARRQEEQKAEEARRLAEERRRSVERRAAAVTGSSQRPQSQYQQDPSQHHGFDGAGDRRSGTGKVSGADVLGEPVSRTQEYPNPRPRVSSAPQPESQPRVQSSAGGTRRSQQSQGAPRQPSAPQSTAGASQAEQGQRTGPTSFPHAFERWETLSSHWEGLTSYWLHKLEQNTEDIRNTIPNASTLNRQITDLSAAGANLFHAVVELQRLRASSERKFQRWFFETRADTERSSEMQAQMDRQLRLERSAREEAALKRAEAEEAAGYAKREKLAVHGRSSVGRATKNKYAPRT
ncbi:hypothetical protein KC345_g10 [Hortaea werneckii]|nr:hypothetical protein KC345_g10 [Hortaea werneckii]